MIDSDRLLKERIRCLDALGKTGSLSFAARRLHMSQANLLIILELIEREHGILPLIPSIEANEGPSVEIIEAARAATAALSAKLSNQQIQSTRNPR